MKDVLIKPLLTEKSLSLASKGWFTFIVDVHSRRGQIVRAVEDEFKVHVKAVRTIRMKSEMVRTGKRRLLTKTKSTKKTLIKLGPDEKIDLFALEQPTQK